MSDDDVIAALARVLAGERAEDVVPATLRAHPSLDDAGRGRLAKRVYGASVLRGRLAHLAGLPAHTAGDARALVDAYVRFEERAEPPSTTWPFDPVARVGVERSAPSFMVRDLVDALGVNGADAFLEASNVPAPAVLRANTIACTRDALAARLLDDGIRTHPTAPTVGAPHALVVEGRANLFGAGAWRDGWFEVQDASSQACVALCDVKPGDTVVNLCAGRGGKTLALAASMQNQGALFVHDVDARALADMRPRLTRARVTCVQPLDEQRLLRERAEGRGADVVLVDAPCSSWGPLRRSPDLRWTQRDDELAAFPPLQRTLLDRAAAVVRPGGRIVYATCTVRRAENSDVVRAFRASSVAVERGARLVSERTLLPHVDGTDGFYVAVLAL